MTVISILNFLVLILIIVFLFKKINIKSDYFFLIFITQSLLYLHVFPTIYVLENNLTQDKQEIYIILQSLLLIFYELPLVFTYLYKKNKDQLYYSKLNYFIDTKSNFLHISVISIFLILPILFIIISVGNLIFFQRIGHQLLYDLTQNLTLVEFYFYRIYKELGLFIIAFIMLLICRANFKSLFFLKLTLLVNILIYGSFVLVNNRLQTILLIALIFGFYIIYNNISLRRIRIPLIVTLFLLLYSVKIVENFRTSFDANNGKPQLLEIFNPFYKSKNQGDPYSNRLNGLFLISNGYEKIQNNTKKYLYFKPWTHSLKVLFGGIFGTEYSKNAKRLLNTNSRSVITKYYFGVPVVDTYQVHISEIFLSFGIFGLVGAALFIANYINFLNKMIRNPKNLFLLLFSILAIYYVLQFEKDFLILSIGWIKIFPVILLLMLVYKLESK